VGRRTPSRRAHRKGSSVKRTQGRLYFLTIADGGRTRSRLHAADQPEEAGPTRVARISPGSTPGGFFSAGPNPGVKASQACPIRPGGQSRYSAVQDIGRTSRN
jgi:hypothetical protein